MDDSVDARLPARVHDGVGADAVGDDEVFGTGDRPVHVTLGCEVQDGVVTVDRRLQRG